MKEYVAKIIFASILVSIIANGLKALCGITFPNPLIELVYILLYMANGAAIVYWKVTRK